MIKGFDKIKKKEENIEKKSYISRICIYVDNEFNVIISPILRDNKGIPRASNRYIKVESVGNDKELAESLMEGLRISENNIQENVLNSVDFWTEATGIKGFAAFSKKHKCVIIDYIESRNIYNVIMTKRNKDGSYGYDKEDIPIRVKEYPGKPSVDTIADQVLGALKIDS